MPRTSGTTPFPVSVSNTSRPRMPKPEPDPGPESQPDLIATFHVACCDIGIDAEGRLWILCSDSAGWETISEIRASLL